jgi:hypothetical protein
MARGECAREGLLHQIVGIARSEAPRQVAQQRRVRQKLAGKIGELHSHCPWRAQPDGPRGDIDR